MSTYENYATRIGIATEQLEADVASITEFSGDLTTAVTRAEDAATVAEVSAQEAKQEVDNILELKPLFKGEYGSVEEYSSRIEITTQEDISQFFGTVFKAKAGCTGISLDVLPSTEYDAFHCYVRNDSGSGISVTSSVGNVDQAVIPNGMFARITVDASKTGWEVVFYTTEGSNAPVRFNAIVEAYSYTTQQTAGVGVPVTLTYGNTPINDSGDAISYDGAGHFNVNITDQYIVNMNASLGRTGQQGSVSFALGVMVNGVKQPNTRHVVLRDGTEVVPWSATYTLTLEAGDVVEFYIESVSGSGGGVFVEDTAIPNSPAAYVVFSQITGAVVSGGGSSFDWTTIPNATESMKGLMSDSDKIKLNTLSTDVATESTNGLMSATDKVKLNSIAPNAQPNVNADFEATSGAALILNKPSNVDAGTKTLDPISGYYVWVESSGKDGYMTKEYARQLEDYAVGGVVPEAPFDGKVYGRSAGKWTEVSSGGGSVSYEDIITRGRGAFFDPITENYVYARHVEIKNQTQWKNIKTPAGLLQAVYGTKNIEEIPYNLGPVPVVFRNTYSGTLNEEPLAAPFALASYNMCLVYARPHASMYEEQARPVNLEGGNVYMEVTFITGNTQDVRSNNTSTFAYFNRNYNIRKYVNQTYSGMLHEYSPLTETVQWPFAWQELVFSDVTAVPSSN